MAQDVKQQVNYERKQALLRQYQADFGGDLTLVDSNRYFVKEGRLSKLSVKTGKKAEYQFILFSDLLIYASEGTTTRYKVHRLLHLLLCRIQDLRSEELACAFRIVSR